MTSPKPKQIDKSKDAARELETDDGEERFDRLLRKVTKTKHSLSESPKLSAKVKHKR